MKKHILYESIFNQILSHSSFTFPFGWIPLILALSFPRVRMLFMLPFFSRHLFCSIFLLVDCRAIATLLNSSFSFYPSHVFFKCMPKMIWHVAEYDIIAEAATLTLQLLNRNMNEYIWDTLNGLDRWMAELLVVYTVYTYTQNTDKCGSIRKSV